MGRYCCKLLVNDELPASVVLSIPDQEDLLARSDMQVIGYMGGWKSFKFVYIN